MDDPGGQVRRDLAALSAQVHALRLMVLRAPAALAVVLIAVGTVIPAWAETDGDTDVHHTYRLLTAGFQAFTEEGGGGENVVFGIGFLGLLIVLVLLCWTLASSVIAGHGSARRGGLRNLLASLAVVGTLVGLVFSIAGWASDEPDTSGGLGPLVVLVGVLVAFAVLAYRPWHDLWVDRPAPAAAFRQLD